MPGGNYHPITKFLTVAMPSKMILPSNITPDRTGGIECSPFGVSISIFGQEASSL
jgi:hypothetical protein